MLRPNSGSRTRIVACIERVHRDADDIAVAGWMLKAIQERAAKHDLEGRQQLQEIVNDVVGDLPEAGKTTLH